MSLRAKLSIAVCVSLLALAGLLYFLVFFDSGPSEDIVVDVLDPEVAPATAVEPPPEPEPTPAQAVDEVKPEKPVEKPAGRPLLASGGWTVFGRIVRLPEPEDPAAGSEPPYPIAGATIYLKPHPRRRSDNPIAVQKRVTPPDGKFEFRGVPGDSWLRLEIDEPASAYRTLSFQLGDPDVEAEKDLGDLPAWPSTTLSFRILGPNDEPVDKARVLLNMRSSNPRRSSSLKSLGINESRRQAAERGDGLYVLERAPRGECYVQAEAPGYAPIGRQYFFSPLEEPYPIYLQEGLTISGMVVSLDGEPIPGAELEASKSGKDHDVESDEEGRFLFNTLGEPGDYSISVDADGFVSSKQTAAVGVEDLRFELEREARFAGAVVDLEDDAPVSDARVTLRSLDGNGSFRADTDAEGLFRVEALPGGRYSVDVDHAEYAIEVLEEPVALETGERREDETIRLKKGLSATGKIVEAESDVGVGDAKILFRLQDSKKGTVRRQATSVADGAFEVKGLGEGDYLLEASAKGYLGVKAQIISISTAGERHFTVELEPGSSITGRVVDGAGNPVAGATVRPNVAFAQNSDWGALQTKYQNIFQGNATAQTDAEGVYRLDGLTPHTSYSVEASHSSYATTKIRKIEVEARSTVEVDLELRRGGTIRGRIVDKRGQAIAAASVRANLDQRSTDPSEEREWISFGSSGRSGTSDAEGYFELQHLAKGTYNMQASIKGLAPGDRQGVQVSDDKVTDGIDIELDEGATVAGRVVDAGGEPVAGATVHIFSSGSAQDTTDADGRFRLTGLKAGDAHTQISAKGYLHKSERVTVPNENLDITLEASARVTGRLRVDPPQVFSNFRITAVPTGDSSRQGGSSHHERDRGGNFSIDLREGSYYLVAMVPGFAPSQAAEFSIRAGETLDGVDIELQPGSAIEGVVVDAASGEPIANASVSVTATGNAADNEYMRFGGLPGATSANDGSFALEGLPPGSLTIQARHSQYASKSIPAVVVGSNETVELRIELGGGGGIYGVVRVGGQPTSGARVQVHKSDGTNNEWKNTNTDGEGLYELKGLSEGEYSVSVRLPRGGRSWSNRNLRATIFEGQMTELNIDQEAGVVVTGTVRSGSQPVAGGRIMAAHPSLGFNSGDSQIDGSGRYSIEVPGPGEYSFLIRWRGQGDNGTRVAVSVPTGKNQVEVDIDLPIGEISGQVVDAESGQPVSGVQVVAFAAGSAARSFYTLFSSMNAMAQSEASGRFVLRDLAPGTYTLRAFGRDYADARVDGVRVGTRPASGVKIPMSRGIGFEVHVVSGQGQPVSQAMAILRDGHGDMVGLQRPGMSDGQGVIAIPSILPGVYDMTITHSGFAPSHAKVTVEEGAKIPRIVLEPGGQVVVSVVDRSGRPVQGAQVFIVDGRGENVLEDRMDFRAGPVQGNITDRQGRLTVPNVRAGSYRGYAQSATGRSAETGITISVERSTEVELVVK